VTIRSDQAYLPGKKVPPLTPNIADVRIQSFQLAAEIERWQSDLERKMPKLVAASNIVLI
jgi:hypothetical protein